MELEIDGRYRIRLTWVMSANQFYGFKACDVKFLQDIQRVLADIYTFRETEIPSHNSFGIGDRCVGKTKLFDGRRIWRRLVVENANVSTGTSINVACRQLDYGILDRYDLADLRPLPKPAIFPLSLPPIAFRFSLYNGQEIDDERFKNVCSSDVGFSYRDFDVMVVGKKRLFTSCVYVVSLYDVETKEDVLSSITRSILNQTISDFSARPSRSLIRSTSIENITTLPTNERRQRSLSTNGRQPVIYKSSKKLPLLIPPANSVCNTTIIPSTKEKHPVQLKSALKKPINVVNFDEKPKHQSSVVSGKCVVGKNCYENPKHQSSVLIGKCVVEKNCDENPKHQSSVVIGKCVVEKINSPEEFYVRFLDRNGDVAYESFKTELTNTLSTMKKKPKRFVSLRQSITVGTFCLFQRYETDDSQKGFARFSAGIVHRVKVGAISDSGEVLAHFLDTGEKLPVDLDQLWPLLPELFYSEIITPDPFVRKCTLPRTVQKTNNTFADVRRMFVDLCKGKTFSYDEIGTDLLSDLDDSAKVIDLRLPDVVESLSKILQALLCVMDEIRPYSYLCAQTVLGEIKWSEYGKENVVDGGVTEVIPKIFAFGSLSRKDKVKRITSFLYPWSVDQSAHVGNGVTFSVGF